MLIITFLIGFLSLFNLFYKAQSHLVFIRFVNQLFRFAVLFVHFDPLFNNHNK